MMSLSSQNKSQQPAAYPTIESIAHPDYTVTLQATLNPQQHYAIHHTKIWYHTALYMFILLSFHKGDIL